MARVLRVTSRSPEDTQILGASLAPMLLPGDVVSLTGDLGAGKTVFVQGLAGALEVTGRVTSPSFTLIHEYSGRFPIVHLDVYRLNLFQEVLDLGFEELLDPEAILMVEWGEAVAPLLPRRYLEVVIRRTADPEATEERHVVFRPHGVEWIHKLQAMRMTADTLLDAAFPGISQGSRFDEMSDVQARDHIDTTDSTEEA